MHRISLTPVARRRLSWIVCLAFFLVGIAGVAAPSVALAADPKIEKEAQALQKKAIEEDNLNVNYAGAVKKLQSAVTKCDGDKCNSSLKASLLRDLGAMQVLNGNVDEGKASFGQAIGMDSSIDLDPAYKNPQLEGIWSDVKKKRRRRRRRRRTRQGRAPAHGRRLRSFAPHGSARPHSPAGLRRVLRQRRAHARHREVQGLRSARLEDPRAQEVRQRLRRADPLQGRHAGPDAVLRPGVHATSTTPSPTRARRRSRSPSR